ncbi:hypothetical protein PCASD_03105 [Puccinia coronata f. sp. avenae]|uniref:Uncharacterized protein n=1 Tax=Puccinia coronata f. sp. avenae TaxID=200324 RepID=A0A2N5V5Q2_9BASI|nr:hypothetical protein PCASD_03105 [Puccinia coronata f. sp. avenae]
MGIRWPQFWLFLFGLLGVIDKSTTFLTSFDGTWNEAINRTKLLVDTRRAAEEILKGRKSPPSWEDVMKTSKKIAGNDSGIAQAKIYDENQAQGFRRMIST